MLLTLNPNPGTNCPTQPASAAASTVAAGLLAAVLAGGCTEIGRSSGVQVWAVSDKATVFPDSPPELEPDLFNQADGVVHLEAAVNETVAFQLVFNSGQGGDRIDGIRVDDFRQGDHMIPAGRVRLYRQILVPVTEYPTWYLRLMPDLRRRREFPDPLVPLDAPRGALPIHLEPGRSTAVWIEVRVPQGSDAGLYRSTIRVALSSGDAEWARTGGTRTFELALTVWPFAVPQTRHLAVLAGLDTVALMRHHLLVGGRPYAPLRLTFDDPVYGRATSLLDDTVRMLHDHRCSPMLRDVHPLRRLNAEGRLELDWADYDRLVAGLVDGGVFEDRVPAIAWPLPVSEREPAPEAYGGWGSAAYQQMLVDYLRQCVAHFRERGWLDRHYVWLPVQGETRGERYRQFEQLGRLIQQVDPAINLVCQLPPQSMAAYGYLADDFLDVSAFTRTWCPPASLADADALARQRSLGKRAWLWPDRPPYAGSLSLIAPSTHIRSLGWQAYQGGFEGIMLPEINRWPDDGLPAAAGSEAALIWPGQPYGLERPIPSIRLKRMLRAAQDYEYLWLLEQNGRPGMAQLVAGDLFSYGGTGAYGESFLDGRAQGWMVDPAAWRLARRLLAQELMTAIEQSPGPGETSPRPADSGRGRFEQDIDWIRLVEVVRGVRLQVEGVRVQRDGSLPTGLVSGGVQQPALSGDRTPVPLPYRVEATVTLHNTTRQPAGGRIHMFDMPADWILEEDSSFIERLEPLRSTRRTVRFRAPFIDASAEGVMPLQLGLLDGEDIQATAPGRVCVLTAPRLERPIHLDGRLDDWPRQPSNAAGDFILMGALDVPKQGRSSPEAPSQQVNAFVCHDGRYLYIGFRCAEDRPGSLIVTRSNAVRYDELWPAGEDLVEVVLDPTGRAVDPGDLLHIVVKANGAVITERGVWCLREVARHEPWPAGVIAAVDDSQPGAWTVEIRIPFEGLGERAPVFGINFARLHARLGEYASWTGARRHLYSPASLGSIQLEP